MMNSRELPRLGRHRRGAVRGVHPGQPQRRAEDVAGGGAEHRQRHLGELVEVGEARELLGEVAEQLEPTARDTSSVVSVTMLMTPPMAPPGPRTGE